MARCAECGAGERDGLTCREQWDELLALEFSDARAGRVHFLTVACYQLQHAVGFGLGGAVFEQLRNSLEAAVVDGRPVEDIRQEASRSFEGARRVRDDGSDPPPEAPAWSHTVTDLGPPVAETHAERVTVWARAILADLSG